MSKTSTSFRLSEEALTILSEAAKANGISQAAVLEMALREWNKKQAPKKK